MNTLVWIDSCSVSAFIDSLSKRVSAPEASSQTGGFPLFGSPGFK
jgi:hypothetical protein